jgi:hypothetical protein
LQKPIKNGIIILIIDENPKANPIPVDRIDEGKD